MRKSDSRRISRYLCHCCKRRFSSSTVHASFHQKRRRISKPLYDLICSGVSQRRAAYLLKVNRKTVMRRFRDLSIEARRRHDQWLKELPKAQILSVQFDDLETSIHSKCKPVSVALSVESQTRKILSHRVSIMPAKGLLAQQARRKYGFRPDQRAKGWREMFEELQPLVHPLGEFTSDENPRYPCFLKSGFPSAKHIRVKGKRGCVAGQGELKKTLFDPLFSLNHTCAMMRANMNRLFRRTWCTSKTIRGLQDHLALYVDFHNRVLTIPLPAPF